MDKGGQISNGVPVPGAAAVGAAAAGSVGVAGLRESIARVFVGNAGAVDQLLCCLLARGHVLIEDVPGVGKTVLATTLARSIDASFNRIQMTPDMLPADILGVSMPDRATGQFVFMRGPIFANIVLADEVNRTTPRTQTAMLEAMGEGTVSIDGAVHQLPRPFMVIATQNPYEFEGTYPLPENQLDRFLMRIRLGYPTAADEARVLEQRPATHRLPTVEPVLHAAEVQALQDRVDGVRMERSLVEYIVALAGATRGVDGLAVGLSPRGSLALAQVARATAVLSGRDYVIPEDITRNWISVAGHRVVSRLGSDGATGAAEIERVLGDVLRSVASPL